MLQTLMVLDNDEVLFNQPIDRIDPPSVKWYWVDFSEPSDKENLLLTDVYNFHHLAVEDCKYGLQRPKVDTYVNYRFFVIHSIFYESVKPHEINLFVGKHYLVSYHKEPNPLMEKIWQEFKENPKKAAKGLDYLLYIIIDHLVDQYFPLFCKIGEELEKLETKSFPHLTQQSINKIFKIRKKLLVLRRSLVPLQEVVRQIIHPEDLEWKTRYHVFFSDVYDNLTRLVEMTEFYRNMGLDLIESVASLNSQRVNRVMMVLTIITTIFMPLSFIAGIYGMNFEYMPELHWKYGYYAVLLFMVVIAGNMILWFRNKGWL